MIRSYLLAIVESQTIVEHQEYLVDLITCLNVENSRAKREELTITGDQYFMLDLLGWRVASRAIFILIAFTQYFESFAIVNLFPALQPFLKKVKNISKLWYRSEINFANCSRQSNLLIPQGEN
jgi:hypothetical protein